MGLMDVDRRTFVLAGTALLQPLGRGGVLAGRRFQPEEFGALADGSTNDTDAFRRLSDELSRAGGGTVELGAGKTYVVGRQLAEGEWAYTPTAILEFRKLPGPLRIVGNGACLKCQSGLRYGSFSRRSGAALHTRLPNYRGEEIASPYRAMILAAGCRGPIEIIDLELDGNSEHLQIGGPWGDTGWQIAARGIWLSDNRGNERLANINAHHHAQDGIMLSASSTRTTRTTLSKVVCKFNGRQGVSVIGGRGFDFDDCDFSFTGRSRISSAPGAGVDMEAETGPIRDISFSRCRFRDNNGCGLVADSGDTAGVRFRDCLFVGSTTWSAWPAKPGFQFSRCTFVGAVVHAYPDKNPTRAARFFNCRFTDDPKLSPSGRVFMGTDDGGPIVNLAESDNVTFQQCIFDLKRNAVLPWTWRATYADCRMSQKSRKIANCKGKFLGHTIINAPVDLYGSVIRGTLVVNGRTVPKGPVGVDPW